MQAALRCIHPCLLVRTCLLLATLARCTLTATRQLCVSRLWVRLRRAGTPTALCASTGAFSCSEYTEI